MAFCTALYNGKSLQTRLPSNLRPTTRDDLHLVTRGHFPSRNKDGGHTIRSAVVKKTPTQTSRVDLCFIEPELLAIEVLHCGNRNFRRFLLL